MKKVVAGALGECVHVSGVMNFLKLAEQAGWDTVFLGPAVGIERFLQAVEREKADLVGVSYRLTPENGERLLADFAEQASELHASGTRFLFGGTPPVAEKAERMGFFERVFDGSQPTEELLAYLKGIERGSPEFEKPPQSTVARILWKRPYPLLRHHFGLPDLRETITGIEKISEAKVLDVISLGIDQDAQENFFHPERQDIRRKGAGGVPVRSSGDYRRLFGASRRGNFPLLRTYSGSDDFLELAEMYLETINIAWCAIPLFWFNQMDGRGPWDLVGSIREHQKVMSWYGGRGIPVELNEPHHWGMREAPDVVFVASAYLAAYNARAFGVHDYIAQMMFNSPPGLSDRYDLARMLAVLEMISDLETPDFQIWKQTRTGLLSYPLEINAARAHLSASIYLQMALKPDIVHIVGHTEAHHAATAEDVIEAGLMARRAIDNALRGQPDLAADPVVQNRKQLLIGEAALTLEAIRKMGISGGVDPYTDPKNLAEAVKIGILDAPHLLGSEFAKGTIETRIVDGGSETVDENGNPLNEKERLDRLQRSAD